MLRTWAHSAFSSFSQTNPFLVPLHLLAKKGKTFGSLLILFFLLGLDLVWDHMWVSATGLVRWTQSSEAALERRSNFIAEELHGMGEEKRVNLRERQL